MRRPSFFASLLALFASLTALSATRSARAEAQTPALAPWKIGLTPYAGGGIAGMTHAGGFPGFVGFTVLGGELQYHSDRVGGFVRGYFLSSGGDGRWTAPALSLGGSYNLFGDGWDKAALYARGSFVYERWHARLPGTGCDIRLLVPSQCPDYVYPPSGSGDTSPRPASPTSITTDLFGIAPAVRLELPIHHFYVAFDAEAAALTSFSSDAPGTLFELRFAIVIGAHDRRPYGSKMFDEPDRRQRTRQGTDTLTK